MERETRERKGRGDGERKQEGKNFERGNTGVRVNNGDGADAEEGRVGEWTQVIRKKRESIRKRWDNVRVNFGKKKGEVSSFFFTAIPDSYRARDLHQVFSRFGDVDEVVIPSKVDIRGKRYGFVRFFNVTDPRILVCKLDGIYLEGVKIQVNTPRFSRNSFGTYYKRRQESISMGARKRDGLNLPSVPIKRFSGQSESRFMDSFVKVVKEGKKDSMKASVVRREEQVKDIRLQKVDKVVVTEDRGGDGVNEGGGGVMADVMLVTKSNEKRVRLNYEASLEGGDNNLRNSFVGMVRLPGMTYMMQNKCHEEGYFDVKVIPLGPNLCLLEDLAKGAVETMVDEGFECVDVVDWL